MKKTIVSFADFQKLDLRVGEVKEALRVKESQHLISMTVDLGDDYGTVEILAGLADFFKPEDLIGKKFVFVANLEPKKMLNRQSNGMILVAEFDGQPMLIQVHKKIPKGSIVR
ncbi:MAG: methionine--tRNA ligase [Microgenomates group bacterium]|nr:methionine--tRNA ligase [Microgenomates group bacterium]